MIKRFFLIVGVSLSFMAIYTIFFKNASYFNVIVWNSIAEPISINGNGILPGPNADGIRQPLGANPHRYLVRFYRTFQGEVKDYHYTFFDVKSLKKHEKVLRGLRFPIRYKNRTVMLGCPISHDGTDYNFITLHRIPKIDKLYAVCANINYLDFLSRYPVNQYRSIKALLREKKQYVNDRQRIRVFNVTPAHASFATQNR